MTHAATICFRFAIKEKPAAGAAVKKQLKRINKILLTSEMKL